MRKLIISCQNYAIYFQVLAQLKCLFLRYEKPFTMHSWCSQLVFVRSLNVKCLIYSIHFIRVKGTTDLFFSRCSVNKPRKLSFVYYILNDCLALKEMTSCKAFVPPPPKKSTSCNLMMFHYILTQEDTHTVDSQHLQ